MKRIQTLLLLVASLSGCSDKESESPLFAPGEVVTIKGQYLKSDGSPLVGAKIQLQNLRRFGYIDYTQATIDNILDAFITVLFFP